MTRTLEDAVVVFQAIVGEDPNDPFTVPSATLPPGLRPTGRPTAVPDYRASLRRNGLKGARIGVLRQAYERESTDPEVVTVFTAALEDLRKAGALIVDPVRVELGEVRRAQGSGPCAGFKHDIDAYLKTLGERVPVKNLQEVIRSRRFHPSIESRLTRAQEGAANGLDSEACKAEGEYRDRFRAAVLKTMEANELQAFVYPTWSNVPRLIGDLNTPHGDNSQVFSPTTGWPSINVPMGYTRENTLPIGITFFGKAWDEPTLIRLAYSYEQATKHRRPPATTPPLAR